MFVAFGRCFSKNVLLAISVLLISISAPSVLQAAQTLADGDWFERKLGDGVVWRYYLFDDLHGSPQSISYIDADLSNPNVSVQFPFLAAGRQRTSSMVPSQVPQAKAAINGSYFATSGPGGHVTYLRINDNVIPPGGDLFSSWGYEGALALTATGSASIAKIPGGGWADDTIHPDIMACGPIVLYAGKVPTKALNSIGAHSTARHPRSAVGMTAGNHLILFTVDGRTAMSAGMSCEELGYTMLELGCDSALNLDGGGSTTLWGAGEQYNGVLNYPTDNGLYDHVGERAVSNAISVSSINAPAKPWDARLTQKTFSPYMTNGSSQSVQLKYKNIGTSTWTAANTKVVLSRPTTRTSTLQSPDWITPSQPAVMSPPTVAPGQTATFTFTLQSPVLAHSSAFLENFMLTQKSVGRIGPADSEASIFIAVQLPVAPYQDFIVESRPGGQNSAWYSDIGMADTSTNCTAPGLSTGVGTRYGSTYRSVAGAKSATTAPEFPEDGFYNVYVAWPDAGFRRSPITYHVNVPGSTETFQLDQTSTANAWVQLGSKPYFFEKGAGGSVVMTNEDIDVSGNMYAGAVKFQFVSTPAPVKSYEVNYLAPEAEKPVIDGIVQPGEWHLAAPAASGFVRHDNPAVQALEDGNFRMLFDDAKLYVQFTMANSYLPSYPAPPAEYGYSDIAGDKISFYITPGGVNRQKFYRVTLSPNPTNGNCYVWSQANLVKTTSAFAGTDWQQRTGGAYTYAGGQLTVEYSIPWAEFNYPGMVYTSAPGSGEVWGIQPAISNRLSTNSSESVNWEPDATPGFVFGEPFGKLTFMRPVTAVDEWSLY